MSLTCLNFMVIIKPKVLFQFRTLHYLRPDTCRSYIKILTMNTNILLHDLLQSDSGLPVKPKNKPAPSLVSAELRRQREGVGKLFEEEGHHKNGIRNMAKARFLRRQAKVLNPCVYVIFAVLYFLCYSL